MSDGQPFTRVLVAEKSRNVTAGPLGSGAGGLPFWVGVCAMAQRAFVSVIAVVAAVATTVGVPVSAQAAPAAAATRDGSTSERAAASCWDIKQKNPAATDGLYWLQTPQLGAPQQFRCDMTTDGGGWVLIGRGRTGWSWNGNGRNPGQVATTWEGTAAFNTAFYPDKTVDGLLAGTDVKALTDGVRVNRARNAAGTQWQDLRLKFTTAKRWSWNLEGENPVQCVFGADGTKTATTYDCNLAQDQRRMFTFGWKSHNWQTGFSYGSSITGANNATSYLWQYANEGAAIPFAQVWIRPKVTTSSLNYSSIPDSGLPADTRRAMVGNDTSAQPWGVTGVAGNPGNELETEVQALKQVGNVMFVGGHFKNVQQGAAGAPQAQSYLAAFDVNTGEWISSFRPTFNDGVWDVEPLPNGQILVGGEFTSVNGDPAYKGLVSLDPVTGQVSPGWGMRVFQDDATAARVRTIDTQDGWIYFGGRFNRTEDWKNLQFDGSTVSERPLNLGRMDASTYKVDWKWRPNVGAEVVSLDASDKGDLVYIAGYFNLVNGVTTQNATAVSTADGAGLLPGFLPFIGSAGGKDEYQQAILEAKGNLWVGGSEHSLWREDRNTGVRLDGYIGKSGGDIQAMTEINGVLYAGGHFANSMYSDVYTWPNVSGFSRSDKVFYIAAWDAATGDLIPTFVPNANVSRNRGPWALTGDSNGCLWFGGDYNRGTGTQWLGGFGRLCPQDATPPDVPTGLAGTTSASGTTLTWGAVAGAATYQVYSGDRIVTTTTKPTATLGEKDGGRYFVRALDSFGNASATTSALALDAFDEIAPGAPGQPVVGTVTRKSVALTWPAATDNVGVVSYRVVRDGVVVASGVKDTSFEDAGLSPETSYSYTVRAVDAAGNVGPDSAAVVATTSAPIPPLFADTFSGADGAAWLPDWTTTVNKGVVDLLNGSGRLASDGASAYSRGQLTGPSTQVDSDVTLTFTWDAADAGSNFTAYLRGSGGWANGFRPKNGLGVELAANTRTVNVRKVVNGAVTTLGGVSSAQVLGTGPQQLRLQVQGSTVRFKIWPAAQSEPAAWSGSFADSSVTGTGTLFLSQVNGGTVTGTRSVRIDDLVMTAP